MIEFHSENYKACNPTARRWFHFVPLKLAECKTFPDFSIILTFSIGLLQLSSFLDTLVRMTAVVVLFGQPTSIHISRVFIERVFHTTLVLSWKPANFFSHFCRNYVEENIFPSSSNSSSIFPIWEKRFLEKPMEKWENVENITKTFSSK